MRPTVRRLRKALRRWGDDLHWRFCSSCKRGETARLWINGAPHHVKVIVFARRWP